ncbi:MAG: YkgJ family cysteine cluster protein [Gammaproteobacteria bacterium]|nr:YkgJ family cysteine cluster protein [Gammaproteobacteria bacterium]
MEIDVNIDPDVSCSKCEAVCCRLEVLLLADTGVPEQFVEFDPWGGGRMRRLDDGWCAALDRNTLHCTIYDRRPFICRELDMGGDECVSIRKDHA